MFNYYFIHIQSGKPALVKEVEQMGVLEIPKDCAASMEEVFFVRDQATAKWVFDKFPNLIPTASLPIDDQVVTQN